MIKPYNFEYFNGVIFPDECTKPVNWNEIFNNKNNLIVEIGCGNGHFLNKKALDNPDKNYIGIEMKGKRIIRCREKEIKHKVANVKWICCDALTALKDLFEDSIISEIYMVFPDPWPKRRHHKHRLFKSDFIDVFLSKLITGGVFIFITDFTEYFNEAYQIISADKRVKASKITDQDIDEFTFSFFGEKWKQDKRNFYGFIAEKI